VSSPRYVIDASALLCVLFDEPGAVYVAERMSGALVSAVNYHEVIAKLVDRGTLDFDVVPVDRHQAELAGLMRTTTADAGLSLGDRSCLALALVRRATALTTDRAWQVMELEILVEPVR
jgi:ribonuclease VapC